MLGEIFQKNILRKCRTRRLRVQERTVSRSLFLFLPTCFRCHGMEEKSMRDKEVSDQRRWILDMLLSCAVQNCETLKLVIDCSESVNNATAKHRNVAYRSDVTLMSPVAVQ